MSQTNFKDKGRSNRSLLLFGDGDGGGGPQLEHLERLERLKDFEGAPKVKFSTCHDFFSDMEAESKNLMKWEGELYLELHNGTYTSVAEVKNYCRRMEIRLRDTEIISVMAAMGDDVFMYQRDSLRNMWQTLLFDQFHDVLPGTCIGLAYEDTRKNFAELSAVTHELIQAALKSIVGSKLGTGINVVRVLQVRPHFDELKFDNDSQGAVIVNTLSNVRFEHLRCAYGVTKMEGNVLINNLGIALVDKKHLLQSATAHKLAITQVDGNYHVENRYYVCTLDKDGSFHSF
jgi:alpha-mannosidase